MSEHRRGASTYENARQIKSEQMRIPIKSAWQGGALPLSYTRAQKWVQIIARRVACARFFLEPSPWRRRDASHSEAATKEGAMGKQQFS
jgi:hypothetical protein